MSRSRRRPPPLVPFLWCLIGGAALAALHAPAPASARAGADDAGFIVVVDVDGLLDPVTADLIESSVADAERERAALLILAVDSPAATDVDVAALAERVAGAGVPVTAWVKSGGVARGGPADLVMAAHVQAQAGNATLEVAGRKVAAEVEAPTLRDLIAVLDGRTVTVNGEPRTLRLGEPADPGDASGDDQGSTQVLPVRFRELGLWEQAQHALASPFVAYLLLMLGLCLVVFEFFAIGIGLAAAAGAVLILASFVGFNHLPVEPLAVGVIVGGVAALAVDIQAGRPRFWAVVGTGLVVAGSLTLYDGPPGFPDPPVWQVVLIVAGALLFLLPGLAAMIRARFSTPTIGRDWMVGETGTAEVAFDQDGLVTVRGVPWRARSTRAARILPGQDVRVIAIRGLLVEVEPVEDATDG